MSPSTGWRVTVTSRVSRLSSSRPQCDEQLVEFVLANLASSTAHNTIEDVTYPTAVLTFLPSGALFARFDPTGRFIAAGRHDGQLVIWDMDVREPARVFDGHVKALTSVRCVFVNCVDAEMAC